MPMPLVQITHDVVQIGTIDPALGQVVHSWAIDPALGQEVLSSFEKFKCATDNNTAAIFNKYIPAIKQALITLGNLNNLNRPCFVTVYDTTNSNTISATELKKYMLEEISRELRGQHIIKFIADKSVICDDYIMIKLRNSYALELAVNSSIRIDSLIGFYLNEWRCDILNKTPFIAESQYEYGLKGVVHNTIAEKVAYLNYCFETNQHLVNPRGDVDDMGYCNLVNKDKENFFSYMRILDRIKK